MRRKSSAFPVLQNSKNRRKIVIISDRKNERFYCPEASQILSEMVKKLLDMPISGLTLSSKFIIINKNAKKTDFFEK